MFRIGFFEIVVILIGGKLVFRYGLQNNFLVFMLLCDLWVMLFDIYFFCYSYGMVFCKGFLYIIGGVCGNIIVYYYVC